MSAIRRPGTASAAILVGLSLSLVVAHAVAPRWSRCAGLDVWNLPALERTQQAAADELAEIEARAEQSLARRTAANQVAAHLAAGGTSLPAAADIMAELFRDDLGMTGTLNRVYANEPSLRHRFARHAIERVARLPGLDPARLAAVVERLEAECRTMPAPSSL